ncbi:MAG: VWA domain-containing protein [Victivallales bacterium]|nr:VWA domain-containing protein [Victivallales bacterium]
MWAAAAACFAVLVSVMTWPALRGRLKVAKQEGGTVEETRSTLPLNADIEAAERLMAESEDLVRIPSEQLASGKERADARARLKASSTISREPAQPTPAPARPGSRKGMGGFAADTAGTVGRAKHGMDGLRDGEERIVERRTAARVLAKGPRPKPRVAPAKKTIAGGEMGGGMGGGMGGAAGAGMGGGMGGGMEDAIGFVVAAPKTPELKVTFADAGARPTRAAPSAAPARRAPAPAKPVAAAGNTGFSPIAGGGGAEAKVPVVGAAPLVGRLFRSRDAAAPKNDATGPAKPKPAPATARGRFQPVATQAGWMTVSDFNVGTDLHLGTKAKAGAPSREAYDRIQDNPYKLVRQDPLSTFSIDVDTASYANVRRFLTQNQLPPKDAVRIEELVNYFLYSYEEPKGERPFSVSVDLAQCPWAPKHRLARVALKGREPDLARRPASNLVFLLDVSGSMNQPNKLPLVKKSMKMLVDHLGENDRVAIVVYAGASGLVLPSTNCDRKEQILAALDRLSAGGSTNGGAGIQLAYQTAVSHFIKGGTNRVLLATDGDFNVGVSNRGDLTRLIEQKAKSGVFLTVLGFGNGNLQDATLEQLSGKGNGTYAYIDSTREARKVMVEQIGGTLLTIAKDVKIQVEFNPARIGAYRLIGYENRMLAHQDFNDDKKDAGEIGAGLTVTAFYELVPRGVKIEIPGVDPLKYQAVAMAEEALANEAMTVKLRYKLPDSDTSTLLTATVKDEPKSIKQMSDDYIFATSVAAFGMVLRDSPYKGSASFALAEELGQTGARRDPNGYRKEFLELLKRAKTLKRE